MQTRIRKHKLLGSHSIEFYPEYKSSRFMPWRRITNKQGEKIYASKNSSSLMKYVQGVQDGTRKPTYPKESNIVYHRK